MSIQVRNEIEAMKARIDALEKQLAEAMALLRSMARASTPKAK